MTLGPSKHIVGIDLGTTHAVVAWCDAPAPKGKKRAPTRAPVPEVFEIPQLVAASEIAPRALLPTCLYAPVAGEVEGDPVWVTGEHARRRGAEVTGRFVASAKSWLSHAAVDRLAAILPWGADEGTPRVSPVDASARYLTHVRDAWDAAHPHAPLATLDVVLTVPASFDEVARALTLEAAKAAGLTVRLLEEPTAAFYEAMRVSADVARLAHDAGGEELHVLVVDVGGGTTDLSLVAVKEERGQVAARRVATGRHILLGGDNMDLALAHIAEARLVEGGERLDPLSLGQLVVACRDAKERVLGGGVDEARVTLLGRGSKLVGGARAVTLTRAEIESVVVDGFFPRVERGAKPERARAGLVAFGLPYERDPAITRHVAAFLARHAEDLGDGGVAALLLNGGVFRAEPVAAAMRAAVAHWSPDGRAPHVLPNVDPELAVARGAVLYGLALRDVGRRVESSAARGYYVGVATDGGDKRAVCILPRGAREGERHVARERVLELAVGRAARFDLYASDVARHDAGDVVTIDDDAYESLPPIVARLPSSGGGDRVAVTLSGELSATGQLVLSCVPVDASRPPVRLEFELRAEAPRTSVPPAPTSIAPSARASAPPAKLDEARRIVEHVFGKKAAATEREVKDVVRDLEKVLGERPTWPMDTVRALADVLLANPGARRRSPEHERAFWALAGFCMRPGFGDLGDAQRVSRFAPLFEGRLAFPDEARGWQQFFIAWRRVAGGLDERAQLAIRDAFDGVLAPKGAGFKAPKRAPHAQDEMMQTLAALERVPADRRAQLGDWLVERTYGDADSRLWSAIARVGARVPLYASVHHVVPAKAVEPWIERLLREKWPSLQAAPHAAVQLARVTGDRARDVSERLRGELVKRMVAAGAKDAWVQAVREHVEVSDDERREAFGEGLPQGLSLAAAPAS